MHNHVSVSSVLRALRYATGSLVLLSLLFVATSFATGRLKQDDHYYIEAFHQATLETIREAQPMINRTPEGAVKDKQLLPEVYWKRIWREFSRSQIGMVYIGSASRTTDVTHISALLDALVLASWTATDQLQRRISTESDDRIQLKLFISPMVVRQILEKFSASTGVQARLVSNGYLGRKSRNPKNEPTKLEAQILTKMSQKRWKMLIRSGGYTDAGEYLYILPLYTTTDCLACHGMPRGAKDAYGFRKEGYRNNQLRGGASFLFPKKLLVLNE